VEERDMNERPRAPVGSPVPLDHLPTRLQAFVISVEDLIKSSEKIDNDGTITDVKAVPGAATGDSVGPRVIEIGAAKVQRG
jgi:hypothetical protein